MAKYKPYRFLLYVGLRILVAAVPLIPQKAALFIAEILGRLAFLIARRERQKTLAHLAFAYGARKDAAGIHKLGQGVFIHFAKAAVDTLRLPRLNKEELNQLIEPGYDLAVIDRLLSEGRGIILLTAHLGNWELLGAFLRSKGYEGALVGRKIYYERFNEVLLALRGKWTLKTIYQDSPPHDFLRILKQNQILAILADQDVDRLNGIFVPFFGHLTYTLTSPVRLAMSTGSPILPIFLVRNGEQYKLLIDEPIRIETRGNREEILQEYTQRWSKVIEDRIRMFPDQWVWMHRRWKTQMPSQPQAVEVSSL